MCERINIGTGINTNTDGSTTKDRGHYYERRRHTMALGHSYGPNASFPDSAISLTGSECGTEVKPGKRTMRTDGLWLDDGQVRYGVSWGQARRLSAPV